jgi:UDP:flavonoid glycosyltransferase YjiC (YdhE family)
MVITIVAVGSRGDFDPLLAFGIALAEQGHQVCIATHPKFESRVGAAGLGFAPLAEGELSKGLATEQGRKWLQRGSRRLPTVVALLQDARSVARRRLEDALSACEGSEAIVAGELGLLLGWQMSQRYRVPLVRVRLSPPPRLAQRPVAGAVRQVAWLAARLWLDSIRRQVGLGQLPMREPLGEIETNGTLELRAYSPALVPSTDAASGSRHATGYWFLEPTHDPEPPQELRRFIEEGAPPVCVGFGSMDTADPAAMRELILQALDGRRGVLVGDLHSDRAAELPGSVFAVGAVDHGWLFERCAAAVHHGGAGTTAAALRAGVPSVIVPHMLDQRAWAQRLRELGASPVPIPRRKLSAQRLRERIAAATDDPRFVRRTAALREQIAEEDGIANALDAFSAHLGAAERQVPTTTHG